MSQQELLIQQQDAELASLSAGLSTLKDMSLSINSALVSQNETIEDMELGEGGEEREMRLGVKSKANDAPRKEDDTSSEYFARVPLRSFDYTISTCSADTSVLMWPLPMTAAFSNFVIISSFAPRFASCSHGQVRGEGQAGSQKGGEDEPEVGVGKGEGCVRGLDHHFF